MAKIFLSAVTGQFKKCRDEVASDLRAIGCEVRVQEDFRQGPRTLIEQIERYVDECEWVMAVVGDAYGCEAAADAVPGRDPPRSYTQWEYFLATGERLSGGTVAPKKLLVYLASESYLREHGAVQREEDGRRQRAFMEGIKRSGKHWGSFDSFDQLCRLVLRDGGFSQERPRRPRNIGLSSLGTLFKGREQAIAELHAQFSRAPQRPVVLHGLGGVGKTRLAVEYSLAHEAEYSALLSVGADSPQALRRNLAALCTAEVLELPERDAKEEKAQFAAALRWLKDHSGWLLILDNVDTLKAAKAVEELVGRLRGGHVLITSRVSAWSGAVETRELEKLVPEAAVAFLLERTDGKRRVSPRDAEDAADLAEAMGWLPLALEQAAAFVAKKRASLAEYLERWQKREVEVREWCNERLMMYPRSVVVTWDTSFEEVGDPGRALLQLLAWLAPDPIPRTLLMTEEADAALARGVQRLRGLFEPPSPAPELEEAIEVLSDFSLLQWELGNAAFTVHRLVQEITRDRVPVDQRAPWLELVLSLVNAAIPASPPPPDIGSWPIWGPLQTHIATVVAAADADGIPEPTSRLLNELALFKMERADWRQAEPLMRRALAITEKIYGPDHPNVATALNNLAQLLGDTNRFAEAEPMMRRVLAIDESHGPDHPDVARALNNLAGLLQDANRLAEAEPLMRRALAIDEKIYGPDHPCVAIALNNLAGLLRNTNRFAEAEPLMRRALAITEKIYGPDHPRVALSLNNLAQLLRDTNRLAEAEPLMRRALAIFEKSYGPNHPYVVRCRSNLNQLLLLQAADSQSGAADSPGA